MGKYLSHLYCNKCSEIMYDTNKVYYLCSKCGGIIETVYEYDQNFVDKIENKKIAPSDIMPFSEENYVDLGQGSTALVKVNNIFKDLDISLYLKGEYQNPTGSFKDRPVGCGVSKAKELNISSLVVASSGNGAAAVSAFAAKAGMSAEIYVPESTPNEKVKQAEFYGGKVVKIPGPYSNSYNTAIEVSKRDNKFNLTTTFVNPYTLDGDKLIAYELYFEIGVPDYIYVPIGAGPLLVGILKGYEELKNLNLIEKIPKMVGVQAEGCSPIVKAFNLESKVVEEETPKSVASAICDGLVGYEQDGDYTIEAVRRSGGVCISVNDDDILKWQKKLAENEGIFVEPSSASVIGAIDLMKDDFSKENKKIVALMTGHGLKDMKIISN